MKKIIITLLILFATKLIVAQEITSPLTQLTTDIMTTEAKQNFNWHTVSNPNIAAKIKPSTSSHASIILLMFDIGDGADGSGEPPPCLRMQIPELQTINGELWQVVYQQYEDCSKVEISRHKVIGGTNTPPPPPSGPPPSNPPPSDPDPSSPDPTTGTGGFPPIGIPPGPIPPIGSEPTPSFPSGSGGGGGSTTSTAPSVPPPAEPADDPNGGSAHPPVKKDSMPTVIDCAADVKKMDSIITAYLASVEPTPEMQNIRANVHGPNELSLSIYDSSGQGKVMTGSTFTGNSTAVNMMFKDSTNTNKIRAVLHNHTDSADANPDCGDLYNLLYSRLYPSIKTKNPYIQYSFIPAGDINTDLALSFDDTSSAQMFINLYQKQDAIHFDIDSSTTPPTKTNPTWADYKQSGDKKSMKKEFKQAYEKLKNKHYPEKLLNTFAQVYMLEKYGVGVKILMKVNGQFKQLSTDFTTKSNGTLKDIIIKICK